MFRTFLLCVSLILVSIAQAQSAGTPEYEFAASSRAIMHIGSGQTLSMLVQEMYPGYKKLWPQIEQEIRRLNPQAFNRYTGRIIPGRRLQLVTIKVIRESYIVHKTVVGQVEAIKGTVEATDTRGSTRTLSSDSEVYEGDRITSMPQATLKVKMVDGAEFYLKPDSSFRLTEYRLKSAFEKGSRSIIDLIKGGLRTLTGAIAHNPTAVYRFQTGIMTIGVRGTDFVVKLCVENNCRQSAGRNSRSARLHVVVLDGLISLTDEEGVVGDLLMGQYAIASSDEKVMINDAFPVPGLLDLQEQKRFNQLKSPKEDGSLIWPWLLGGALLGL